ncbi:general transcription factor 3C polypeptide 3 isoform X2 [Parasteatoda tepidariorum]|uniref:general transcription factor 3C polypeptide 3 isoform X1 n=1 Tax=Parasteatoda tepidariorum TaxID=114398 RepID=UPI001C72004C|nr:general transcription factor 3C polypeptide 3 isoform X1 [Parasteatoda tepidariorum]XP_042901215.1 general transcription factor 3C polypeptide 3 isoform X2 [Parasteatoda tepidariorum]
MSANTGEGTSTELLESIIGGEVSVEQWEQYKEQNSFLGMEDSGSESDGSNSMSLCDDMEVVTNVEVVELDGNEPIYEESDEDSNDQVTWGYDAANKYIRGEISIGDMFEIAEGTSVKQPARKKLCTDKTKKQIESKPQGQEEDVEIFEGSGKQPRKIKKDRKKQSVLPKHLLGLMGAANLAFANGKTEEALKMCLELIKLAPNANEPFHTLGLIYDELGEARKAFQCYLVAAFLNPSDTDEWIRLAELSIEHNDIKQAVTCYTRALRNDPSNISYLWERCNLYEQLGVRKRALTGYELIIKHLSSPEDGEKCADMAREIAKMHHDNNDDSNAVKVLETAFTKFPSLITSEDVNFLIELQLGLKMYKSAVKTMAQHCEVKLKIPDDLIVSVEDLAEFTDEDFKDVAECNVPEQLPIDLVAKFLICIIHLRSNAAFMPLLENLKAENPEEVGDLFLDVAEALMETKEYESAKKLLQILISSSSYNLAAVWMKYADCLHALSETDAAIHAYGKVIQMSPTYQDARLSLSKIFLDLGRKEEAMSILKQDFESGSELSVLGAEALYQRCKLLESEERWDEFITTGVLLQYSHCQHLETEEEFTAVIMNQTCRRRIEALRELKTKNNKPSIEVIGENVAASELYSIFKKVCNKLLEKKRFEDLQNLSLAVLSSVLFMKKLGLAKELEFQALLSCYYNNNAQFSYLLCRDLVLKNLHNNKVWNLFCLILNRNQETRHNKFCLRLMMKHQDHLALGFFNGHNAMISGTYKHALGEYMCILKEHPNDSFITFCVGITFIHMACQKFATKRHLLTVQGFAFLLKYLKLKGECQETLYNIGRAFHQLGIKDLAVHYYKKALMAPNFINGPDKDTFDLRREIAYNLCLIYKSTGALDLVYLYSRKYITV